MKKSAVIGLLVWAMTAAVPAQAALEEAKKVLPLGSQAPDFKLPDVTTGAEYSLADFAGEKALVVAFICRHCPYVKHMKRALAQLAKDYQDQEIRWVAISANDPEAYPEDAPARLKEMAAEEGFTFPFLFDETQDTARNYTASATPDIFIFDSRLVLVYRGQFDDTRPGGGDAATGADVRAVLDALLNGQPVPAKQKRAVGCSIKWKK